MAKIQSYPKDTSIIDDDKVLGTDWTGNITKNYPLGDLTAYFSNAIGVSGTIEEDLIGEIDGVNTVFTTTYPFRPETVRIYLNGIKEKYFEITGANEITIEDPPSDIEFIDSLVINYIKI